MYSAIEYFKLQEAVLNGAMTEGILVDGFTAHKMLVKRLAIEYGNKEWVIPGITIPEGKYIMKFYPLDSDSTMVLMRRPMSHNIMQIDLVAKLTDLADHEQVFYIGSEDFGFRPCYLCFKEDDDVYDVLAWDGKH